MNGDIVDMDWNAAKVALEAGEIEIYEENSDGTSVSAEVSDKGSVEGAKIKVDRTSPKSGRVRKTARKKVRV